jgi:hypothetical protein
MSVASRSKSMKQKLADAEEIITALKSQLYGLPGKIMELESENAALKAVLRCQKEEDDGANDYNEEDYYERPDGMSDKEFRAYIAFRNQRKDIYPDYTEMTIAPLEESEWQQRVQEMREDGLWED